MEFVRSHCQWLIILSLSATSCSPGSSSSESAATPQPAAIAAIPTPTYTKTDTGPSLQLTVQITTNDSTNCTIDWSTTLQLSTTIDPMKAYSYYIYALTSNPGTTWTDIQTAFNAVPAPAPVAYVPAGALLSAKATRLSPATSYYFVVTGTDAHNKLAAYGVATSTTLAASSETETDSK